MKTHRNVILIRRIAVLTGLISIVTYPALAFLLVTFAPTADRMITLHVLSVAPYGVAISIAALGLAHHLDLRHRAKRSPTASKPDTLIAATVNTIVWAAVTLISIPATTVVLYLSVWMMS